MAGTTTLTRSEAWGTATLAGGLVTGIGVVAPTGVGVAEHWATTLRGEHRLGHVPAERASAGRTTQVAGLVEDFDADAFVDSRVRVQTDRWTWMALAATRLALTDAGLDPAEHDPYGLSVVTSSGSGGNEFGQREIHALWSQGPDAVSAYQSIGWFYAASSGQISIRDQLKGQCGVMVADGAGGIDAAAMANRLLRRGTDAVVVGGTEAAVSPYALACQAGQRTWSDDPDVRRAYRPFAADAGGFVPGEGGAILVLESPGFAARRGAARAYAQVVATASTHDARLPSDPVDDPRQLARAVTDALTRAGLAPRDVDVVLADGAGDPRGDAVERAALVEVFGRRGVPVSVPKTMTGRLCSGGAALDLAWAALALHHDVVPPSVHVEPDPDLDLVTAPRAGTGLRTALVVARGVGGFNAAAVLRAVDRVGT